MADLLVDPRNGMQTVVSHDMYAMHRGNHFFIKTWTPVHGPRDTTMYWLFTTPPMPVRCHAKASITANREFVIEIYENSIISNPGVPIEGKNNDRASMNPPGLMTYGNPTITDIGDLMWASKIGPSSNMSVGPNFNYEIIGKCDTNYVYKIVKNPDLPAYLDIDFWWSEWEHSC